MADNQLLDAINGIKNSVTAMEHQMRNIPSKTDLNQLVNEIKGVRETVLETRIALTLCTTSGKVTVKFS